MYTAEMFKRDLKCVVAANIDHVWYFKDVQGSSGKIKVFGPNRNIAYYAVETIAEDRYKVYYFRTVVEMIKEIRKDFEKFKKLFPELSLVAHPDLLSNRAYDKVVDKSISKFLRRLILHNLAYAEFKPFAEGIELFFKKQEIIIKKKLFDLLVTKGKLNIPKFEAYYGSMGDEGEDVSERVKHYTHGRWDIYLDVKTKRGIDEVTQLLDNVTSEMKRKGYSKLCYGRVFLVDNLGGRTLADYNEDNDSMRVGFKMLKKSNLENQKISFIHELGHRNYFKFLTSKQRGESDSKFILEAKFTTFKTVPKSGDTLVSKTLGDKYLVERLDYKRTLRYIVKLVELGENTKSKEKDLNNRYAIDDKFIGIEYITEGKGSEGVNTFVPRAYGLKNKFEFYAVLWETWFQDKLKDPARFWFENLEK